MKTTQIANAKNANAENLIDELKLEIDNEQKKREDIEKNIDKFQSKIIKNRQNLGGINAGVENQSALTKQVLISIFFVLLKLKIVKKIKILENRLDKANQKFNEAIAINKNLRQQIDSLRRERVIFDK